MKCNTTARCRARYDLLRSMFNMTTWFCDAYASWQKGGDVVFSANLTPRKCLGYKTPFQAMLADLGKDVKIRFA